jgi:MFS family permease
MLTLAYSLVGMALGPFVVGILADRMGLLDALRVAPFVYVIAIVVLLVGRRCYPASLRKLSALSGSLSNQDDR